MSSGSYGLSVKDLEKLVSYPPRVKPQPKMEPHSGPESRRVLQLYRDSVAASGKDRSRNKVANVTVATQRGSSAVGSSLLEEADKAELAGKHDEALSCLLEAVRVGDESEAILSRIGQLFALKQNPTDALEYFTKAIKLNPLESANYLHKAECYIALDDPMNAFHEFEKYFKLEEVGKNLMVRCGKCALDAEILDRAEYYLKSALSLEEVDAANDAYAWYNLGELAEKLGNDSVAQEYYNNVCKADETFPQPYLDQAEDEYSTGNYSLALHLFEAVAKMTPTNAHVYVRLADVYGHLGAEFSTSVLTCLSKAVELSGDSTLYEETIVRRGVLLFSVFNDVEQAITDFTLCLEGNPYNPSALENRALALRSRNGEGDVAAAVADYLTLVDQPVGWERKAEPYRFLAANSFDQGDFSTAAKLFSFAAVHGAFSQSDELRMYTAIATQCVRNGATFEEQYEPRGGIQSKDEKGKKGDQQPKGYPVVSIGYQCIDQFYCQLRDREPTVHNALEYNFIALWKPFRDDVEKHREEAEALRAGKKGGKRK